jgi:hypothetical protein
MISLHHPKIKAYIFHATVQGGYTLEIKIHESRKQLLLILLNADQLFNEMLLPVHLRTYLIFRVFLVP